jgi:hypothetical protein
MKGYKSLTSVFARIMHVNPNSASAHIMMDTAYDQMSQRADAIQECQAAEKADPDLWACIPAWANLYLASRRNRTGGESGSFRTPALSHRSRS